MLNKYVLRDGQEVEDLDDPLGDALTSLLWGLEGLERTLTGDGSQFDVEAQSVVAVLDFLIQKFEREPEGILVLLDRHIGDIRIRHLGNDKDIPGMRPGQFLDVYVRPTNERAVKAGDGPNSRRPSLIGKAGEVHQTNAVAEAREETPCEAR